MFPASAGEAFQFRTEPDPIRYGCDSAIEPEPRELWWLTPIVLVTPPRQSCVEASDLKPDAIVIQPIITLET